MRTARLSLAAALCTAALGVAVADGAVTKGRQPPPAIELHGSFHRAEYEGDVRIMISELGPRILQVDGILPGRCHDARTGRVARSGRDGAIGVLFVVRPNAPIRPDGSFSFTAKASAQTVQGGYAPHTITMRGTFYGNNVLGRVKGRSGKGDRYSNCTGDQPFWAKRLA